MDAIWTSVVAVMGTLLGSVVTHTFQRIASRRSELFTRSEALRQERMATYSAFAAAVEGYRHGQADRDVKDARARRAIEAFVSRASALVR
ncbi:hypothetical protein ABZ543_07495 [Streptomyces roseifaciens]